MGAIIAKVGGVLLTKLLTEKVIIRILILLAEWLVKKTTNKLDDGLFIEIKKALEE